MTISDGELALRLGLAAVLCGLIGLERESRDQAAGLRTHLLVGLGSALFTLVSAYGFKGFIHIGHTGGSSGGPRIDPTRIAAQIVSGIGFLGAGAIIRQGLNIRGLTTAATLWIVAAVGMAVGAGYYLGASLTTVLVLFSLVMLRWARSFLVRGMRTDFVSLAVEMGPSGTVEGVLEALKGGGIQVQAMNASFEGELESVELDVRVPPGRDLHAVLRKIGELEGVKRAHASGLRPT